MSALVLLVVLLLLALLAALFTLGFRLGSDHWRGEALRVREEGVRASRELFELTRQGFSAMADEVERQRRRHP